MKAADTGVMDVRRVIALFGNLNAGKTTLFGKICDKKPSDFKLDGCSTILKKGRIREQNLDILDTPGATCALFARTDDEKISRDLLLSFTQERKIEGAVLVADAKRLKRALVLALQCAEYEIPILFDVNMVDAIESQGITIDYDALARLLGVPVTATVATRDIGIARIKAQLGELKIPQKLVRLPAGVDAFCEVAQKLCAGHGRPISRGIATLLLLGDKSAEEYITGSCGKHILTQIQVIAQQVKDEVNIPYEMKLANLYNAAAEKIMQQVVVQIARPQRNQFMEKLSEWCLHPLAGFPIAFAVAYLMFLFVGSFGATYLVDSINAHIFEGYLTPWFEKLLAPVPSDFVRELIINRDLGVLPRGLFLALGLVAPILLCYYLFFGILEEVGYLQRVSLLFDKIFQKIGLNGKGVLPLLMGFSCVTMAIMTTRSLDTKRERIIATVLLLFGIPCAPVLAVSFLLLGQMPISATLVLFGIISVQILTAGYILNKLLKGKRTPLLIEVPPMSLPVPRRIVKNALTRTSFFLKEALPMFVIDSMIVFIFDRLGGLAFIQRCLGPLTSTFLGLPDSSVQVFLRTIIRRESGFVQLSKFAGHDFTHLNLVVSMLVLTFFAPCMNSFFVVIKEFGLKTTLLILAVTLTYALTIGAILNHACLFFGITFT